MKTSLLVIFLSALCMLWTSPAANAAEGIFFTASLGSTGWSTGDDNSDVESANSYGVRAGYRWAVNSSSAFGLEAGYADFGSIGADGTISVPGMYGPVTVYYSGELAATATMLGASYELDYGRGWIFDARAGLMQATVDTSVDVPGYGSASESETDNGIYFGAGIGFYLTQNVGLSLNYDFHRTTLSDDTDLNFSTFSFGLNIRF